MSQEKTLILEMINNGKISVDEGIKLLDALNRNDSSNFSNFMDDLKYKFDNLSKPDITKIKENTQSFFNKTEEIFDDFGKSVVEIFKTNENTKNKYERTENNSQIIDVTESNNTQN